MQCQGRFKAGIPCMYLFVCLTFGSGNYTADYRKTQSLGWAKESKQHSLAFNPRINTKCCVCHIFYPREHSSCSTH